MKTRPVNFIIILLLPCINIYLLSPTLHAQCIENTPWQRIVPSDRIPSNLDLGKANNNLDIIRHHDTYYFAFRNAPHHFASKKARIIVLSSSDLETWEFETQIHLNNDLREPRFTSFNDSLYLYFFEGGHNMSKFEPQHIHYCFMDKYRNWSDPINAELNGYVPWRIRTLNGKLYLSAYYGKDLYDTEKGADLRLFESSDAKNWSPISAAPQLKHPRGVSEGEFIFDQEGNIWGVARLEYDGSYTFFADKDSIHVWQRWYSDFKYDSSLIFEENGTIYLIARRNMDGDGRFVQRPGKFKKNLVRYSFRRKKTAIFKLDKVLMKWIHIKDFRSTGDTCFPGIVKLDKGKYYLMNYSSDLDKREKAWIWGQLGKTYIYETELTIRDCK